MKRYAHILLAALAALTLLAAPGCSSEPETPRKTPTTDDGRHKQYLAFGGGPTGGTFNFFANKMASIISVSSDWIDISPKGAGGSAENLRNLDRNGVDQGIVYAGDAFLGRNGKLPDDPTHYDKVRALSFLYSAPAQLVVRKDSDIRSALDLKGRTVAIGNPGSGAALSAERFFRHLGIWDAMDIQKQGYSQAAKNFSAKQIDAFWVLVGYPNSSVIEAASRTPIRLLNLHETAEESGFYDAYPFYSMETIPGGTYDTQTDEIETFQDSALWSASERLDDDVVYACLKAIYSEQGLKDMITAHKAAKSMSIDNGIKSVSIPLHPGAVKFWQEQGVDIPADLMP